MEDNHQQQQQQNPSSNNSPQPPPPPSHVSNKTSNEPVRSRWTPKPEQILILESIFNSGMVNPPKDETVRIRKLLEKFGAVGDANVFYWFQNRRSRSRRRQRQIQATLLNDQPPNRLSPTNITTLKPSSIQFEPTSSSSSSSNSNSSSSCFDPSNSLTFLIGDGGVGVGVGVGVGGSSSSSSAGNGGNGGNAIGIGIGIGIGTGTGTGVGSNEDSCFYSISNQMGLTEMEQSHNVSSMLDTSSNMNYHHHHQQQQQQQQPGFITVFINGVPTEVPNGSLDMRNMFGQDVMLVHSSGVPVPFNEYGFSLQSLHMGESYFLVSRSI